MGGKLSKQELNEALNNHLDGSGISFLSHSDQNDALDVLADAFKDDPMFTWVAGLEEGDPERDQKMYKLCRNLHSWHSHRSFDGSRGVALEVRDDGELVGCMTLSPSSLSKARWWDACVALIKYGPPPMYKSGERSRYGPYSTKRIEQLDVLSKKREEHTKESERCIYLQSIGVRSDRHGKGLGGKMLWLLTKTADALDASIYLETQSEDLESMYKHFGFLTLEKLNISVPGDDSPTANHTEYLMGREPLG